MSERVEAKRVFSSPVHFLAFGLGAGLAPRAPGTAGSLVGVALDALLRSAGADWSIRLVVALLFCVAGIGICGASARRLGEHDHPGIVWDEIAGMMLVLVVAPDGWRGMVFGFILFRVFDILKPWPISVADKKVSGGLGIMLDDVLAALFAMAAMTILLATGII
ncbi:MAG: phosphatidylglycerophosphatase A [Gammaproteobacteria bacterium]|nr:phosphatidylglycerophosphatase A [Gammaproteobacteria bacterium]